MKLKGWGGLGVVRKRYDHHDNKDKEERSSLSGPGPAYAEARAPASTSPPKESTKMIMGDSRFSFDTNMVIILAALLCALICALGLNSMFRYALTCRRSSSNTRDDDGGEEEEEEQQNVLRMRLGMKRRAWKALPAPVEVSKKMNKNVEEEEEEEEEECCAICLGDVVEGDKVRILPKCNHAFHVHCIDTWLVSHSSCPICRQNLNMLNILSSPSHLNYA